MQALKTLIDKASKVCGSDTALAKRMGIHQPDIAAMRAGKRKISPVTAAELADIAGEDAREAAIAAVIESTKGTRREGAMREILGKALAAGVAGMSLISYSGDSISTTDQATNDVTKINILYIASFLRRAIDAVRMRTNTTAGARSRGRLLQRHVASMRPVKHSPVAHREQPAYQ